MKTRKDLEKMFDEEFFNSARRVINLEHLNLSKKIFFETIIPEVIREILPEKELEMDPLKLIGNIIEASGNTGYNVAISQVKQKAKELYGIDI